MSLAVKLVLLGYPVTLPPRQYHSPFEGNLDGSYFPLVCEYAFQAKVLGIGPGPSIEEVTGLNKCLEDQRRDRNMLTVPHYGYLLTLLGCRPVCTGGERANSSPAEHSQHV